MNSLRPLAAARTRALSQQAVRRGLSSKAPSPLQGDAGPLATRVHHAMTLALVVATPVYFLIPEKSANGTLATTFGLAWTATVAAHSWIGLNYVATDYVPKISKSLLGPARYANLAIAAITILGMSKIVMSPGGIKGVMTPLWRPKTKKDPLKDF
jgi:succinate dehydrogenase hydrophobic anchor subunit